MAAAVRCCCVLLALAAASASAQSTEALPWPAKPLRIVIPFSPGGAADTFGRLVAPKLSESQRILALPEVRARWRADGILAQPLGAQAFAEFVAAEMRRWAPVIRASGARAG